VISARKAAVQPPRAAALRALIMTNGVVDGLGDAMLCAARA